MKIQQLVYVFLGAIVILAISAYWFRGGFKVSKAKAYLILLLAMISTIANFLTQYLGFLLATVISVTALGLMLFIFLTARAKREFQ